MKKVCPFSKCAVLCLLVFCHLILIITVNQVKMSSSTIDNLKNYAKQNDLKIIKNTLIVVTLISVTVFLFNFYSNRDHLYEYYRNELEFKGLAVHLIHLLADIIFCAIVILIIFYTILYLYFIFYERITATLIITFLNTISLMYGLTEVNRDIGPTPLDILLGFIQVVLGFTYVYLMRSKTKMLSNQVVHQVHFVSS